MDFVLFMLVSVIESSAVYYLMFRLFKFDIHISSIIFAGLVLAYISYTLRTQFNLPELDIVLQLALGVCFVWLLFKVHPFYSIVMTASAWIGYVVIQAFYHFVMNIVGWLPENPSPTDFSTYALQLFSAATAVLIGYWLHRTNRGFEFVPHSPYESVSLHGRNLLLVGLYFLTVILLTLLHYLLRTQVHRVLIIFSFLLGGVMLVSVFLYWSYKRDRSDD